MSIAAPDLAPAQQARPSQALPWAGWARCQVNVQGPGYTDQQTHTWILTGGMPTVEGAFRVYAATWSDVGSGSLQTTQETQTRIRQWATNVPEMDAPIAVFVRASDGRLLIASRHAQLRASGAINGYQQLAIDQTSQSPGQFVSNAFEWSFPVVEGVSTSTSIDGSSSPAVTGSVGPMQPAGSRGTASCAWQFGQGSAAPAPRPLRREPSRWQAGRPSGRATIPTQSLGGGE